MASVRPFKGLVSLVTGGVGLGPAVARRFAKNGAKVVLCDNADTEGQKVAEDIGSDCIFVPTDITSESDVLNALDVVQDKFGRLDAAINCAERGGVNLMYNLNKASTMPESLFKDIFEFNLLCRFNVIRLAAGVIGKNKPNSDGQKGVIINSAHIAGYDGCVSQVPYASSQGSILAMTLPLARDLSSEGIRVATVAIGNMDIPLHTDNLGAISETQFLMSLPPFPKMFAAADIFAHLCQKIIENPLINGEIIRLDGGMRQIPQIKVQKISPNQKWDEGGPD